LSTLANSSYVTTVTCDAILKRKGQRSRSSGLINQGTICAIADKRTTIPSSNWCRLLYEYLSLNSLWLGFWVCPHVQRYVTTHKQLSKKVTSVWNNFI